MINQYLPNNIPQWDVVCISDTRTRNRGKEVIVARADGEPNLVIPMENDWGFLLHWLDDQNLIMTRLDFPIPFVDFNNHSQSI